MYSGWTQRNYQNKHYNINQKDEGTLDDRGRDGGTNFILRTKEKETRLTLQKHDDDDDSWGSTAIKTGQQNVTFFFVPRTSIDELNSIFMLNSDIYTELFYLAAFQRHKGM